MISNTVVVPPNGGSVTFRTRFEDFLGTVVFHCHLVAHSDLGMMGMARVVPAGRGGKGTVAAEGAPAAALVQALIAAAPVA